MRTPTCGSFGSGSPKLSASGRGQRAVQGQTRGERPEVGGLGAHAHVVEVVAEEPRQRGAQIGAGQPAGVR
ncbi:hypothetical protein [Actinopolymorpha pittospori]|uniref:Uncharacterized protein n=1 Tax=Actinopolymorpha pittospori TaxID=648752 RepID=A0A927R5W9_9ACTN|nr:hypothetical protein [Actinopolymorpha pittospori]MBE1603782.1 hypothetical protein [Actinopolymorpha pittospori]